MKIYRKLSKQDIVNCYNDDKNHGLKHLILFVTHIDPTWSVDDVIKIVRDI